MHPATPWHQRVLLLCCILVAAALGAARAQGGGQPTALLASTLNSLSGAAVLPAAAPLGTIVDTLVSGPPRPRTTGQRGDVPAPAPAPSAQFAGLKDGTVPMKGIGLGGYAQLSTCAVTCPEQALHAAKQPAAFCFNAVKKLLDDGACAHNYSTAMDTL